ncbi:precorrin-6A synthase (deacetylating) [Albidovulum sp.]|uniref:precorrin-6A synthase (deacetylating) n=1 Tax=Albidovulum sp. TaxID=1872424 RepID=UPI001DA65A52|nr:precorrin-6A synthase (deacetylating) [Paracoccaceae bacterium]
MTASPPITLALVGIGTGNPEHLTLQAIRVLNSVDLILIPRKGTAKADLAELRREICARVVTNPAVRIAEFDLPLRDAAHEDYRAGVDDWHDAIAAIWAERIAAELGSSGRVALLVWGDPSLYDSTLRIAGRVALSLPLAVEVVPGITSLQALTAAHAIPLNEIGAPVVVTTGRRLRDEGWPISAQSVAVMLDGECSFQALEPAGLSIWWGAYVGMAEELTLAGPLEEMAAQIIETRRAARARHGWIMDIYILRRSA